MEGIEILHGIVAFNWRLGHVLSESNAWGAMGERRIKNAEKVKMIYSLFHKATMTRLNRMTMMNANAVYTTFIQEQIQNDSLVACSLLNTDRRVNMLRSCGDD